MKRAFTIVGAVGLTVLISLLALSVHLSQRRADRLDRALQDAEARVLQLESDLETANRRLAELNRTTEIPGRPATPPRTGPPATPDVRSATGMSTPAATQAGTEPNQGASTEPIPASGVMWVRYAAVGSAGLTNFVRIEGTSSIHTWQVEGRLIGGSAKLSSGFPPDPQADWPLGSIAAKVNVFIPVRSLKSVERDGRPYSDAMDEIMYGKLLSETHKRITYSLTSLKQKEPRGDPAAPLVCEAVGDLAVAGVTNSITMPVTISSKPDGKIHFTGSVKVKMTDFKIDPPNPAFAGGAIKTGNEVTLSFSWWVNRIDTLRAAK